MTCCEQTRMTVLALISASRDGIDYEVGRAIIDTHKPVSPCERCSSAGVELMRLRGAIQLDALVEPIITAAVRLL